jgi:DNA-binding NtrC family response regulator
MMAQEQVALRTIILHGQATDVVGLPEYRLLHNMGHDVATADTTRQAVEFLQTDRADLVVIDADRAGQRDFLSILGDLPADQQPTQVAIVSDSVDDGLSRLVQKLQRAHVHVLLRPLHMHGLLGVLRNIEASA